MRTQEKEKFDAKWKQYEEVIVGQQQSQEVLTSNLATLQKVCEEELIKVAATTAAKEEDFQRTLAAHDKFHDKELQEYKAIIEFLIRKGMDDKEAHRIQLEEALCKERKQTISKLPDESQNISQQTIILEVDFFKEQPCFVQGHSTSNVSHISVVEELSRVHFTEEKHLAKNFDQQNDESTDDRPTFPKLEVSNQHDEITESTLSWPISPKALELAHFDQKNDVKEDVHQHKMVVNKPESRKKSPKFILSRGFPLRHLARMEANHKKPVTFVSKHECSNDVKAEGELTIHQRQAQLTYLPLDYEKKNLLVEVSQFVYVFQEVVHQFFTQLCVLHFILVVLTHVKYYILKRKGGYFNCQVNRFV